MLLVGWGIALDSWTVLASSTQSAKNRDQPGSRLPIMQCAMRTANECMVGRTMQCPQILQWLVRCLRQIWQVEQNFSCRPFGKRRSHWPLPSYMPGLQCSFVFKARTGLDVACTAVRAKAGKAVRLTLSYCSLLVTL